MLSVRTGAFSILRQGQTLPVSVIAAIGTVSVTDEINVPAMFDFTISLNGPRAAPAAVLDTFSPGDQVTIKMGLDSLTSVIVGEITAIEPRFGAYATATIRGFDRMYRLKFGNDTRVFENLSDNDIVNQVARGAGLAVRTEGIRTTINTYVQQRRQTNYDFLIRRAAAIDHELLMDGTTLLFRPCAEGKAPVRKLAYPRDVAQLNVNLRIPTKGSKVTVRSFDPATNKAIDATSRGATRQDTMGGTRNGYEVAAGFPDSAITLEEPSITSVAALQAVADAQFQANLNRFIEGGASLEGDARLKAGTNVSFSGLSKRFDGIYYVTSSTHSYDDAKGYTTDIKVRRTGL